MGSKLGDRNSRHDKYYKMALKDKFASRAAYKLEEMDLKFQLVKQGLFVLDLGAAPGSWTQYAAKKIGSKGRVFSIDLNPIEIGLPTWCETQVGDIFDFDFSKEIERNGRKFDLVMSDMASNTTGIRFTDATRSAALVNKIIDILPEILSPKGKFTAKIFRGEDFDETLKRLKVIFKRVKTFKPKSSRSESKELYFVAWDRKRRK
jgi:23S rRNA (uridine2552-2'-O)-methyltransferase